MNSLCDLHRELWLSLASLLSSYTALHGLNSKRRAEIEQDEERILVRHGVKWLALDRNGAAVTWKREDGRAGKLEFTEAGRLLGDGTGEEEMDMAAEAWARELMR